MTVQGPQEHLVLAYYRWALGDARREAEQDFPLVRLVRNVSVLIFLDMMEGVLLQERVRISQLLVRRLQKDTAALVGEQLTAEESSFIEAWIRGRSDRLAKEGYLKYAELSPSGRFAADKGRLSKLVKKELTVACGPWRTWQGKSLWQHEREVGRLRIATYLDVGGRQHQLSYGHSIFLGAERIVEHVSLLSWLGIAGQTHWNLSSEADEHSAASALGQICRHFFEAMTVVMTDG